MHESDKTKQSVITLLLAISTMMLASCTTVITGAPKHCTTKYEWPNYVTVAQQKLELHQPDKHGVPTKYAEYAARVAELEGVCRGINAFRGE